MLETSAAVGTSSNSIAILPTGNLVTGQPAAIFSYCQVLSPALEEDIEQM